jgi:multidrug efflux pump subunit AcrB
VSKHRSDEDIVQHVHNTARFFTEQRQISWVLLVGTVVWGVFGYLSMPQRKDPDIPVRVAVATCSWPGASAERIEQLVTRPMEEKISSNSNVEEINSTTRTSVTVITIKLTESAKDTKKEFDDIKLKLDSIRNLPSGAGPINFIKDFGDTAALMLTVASPRVGRVEIALHARDLRRAIEAVRAGTKAPGSRTSIAYCYPPSVPTTVVRRGSSRRTAPRI